MTIFFLFSSVPPFALLASCCLRHLSVEGRERELNLPGRFLTPDRCRSLGFSLEDWTIHYRSLFSPPPSFFPFAPWRFSSWAEITEKTRRKKTPCPQLFLSRKPKETRELNHVQCYHTSVSENKTKNNKFFF